MINQSGFSQTNEHGGLASRVQNREAGALTPSSQEQKGQQSKQKLSTELRGEIRGSQLKSPLDGQ